jgi:anti-sigma factor RsiW
MKCSRMEKQVMLHAHGELSGISRLVVERHLGRCEACRQSWKRWGAQKDRLSGVLGPLPGRENRLPEIAGGVGRRILRVPQSVPRSSPFGGWGGALKLLVIVGGIAAGLSLGASLRPPPPAAPAPSPSTVAPPLPGGGGETCAKCHPAASPQGASRASAIPAPSGSSLSPTLAPAGTPAVVTPAGVSVPAPFPGSCPGDRPR